MTYDEAGHVARVDRDPATTMLWYGWVPNDGTTRYTWSPDGVLQQRGMFDVGWRLDPEHRPVTAEVRYVGDVTYSARWTYEGARAQRIETTGTDRVGGGSTVLEFEYDCPE